VVQDYLQGFVVTQHLLFIPGGKAGNLYGFKQFFHFLIRQRGAFDAGRGTNAFNGGYLP
jgi:hypothetical protein